MIEIGLGHYLTLGAVIFSLGTLGIFLNRKNVIVILMSIELILLAVNINLVSFSIYLEDITGQIFTMLILTVAAAEAAIGLAIIVAYYRNKGRVKPGTKEAIERLQNATLDCASARAALEAYSNVRDVCTLSIVLKSVSKRFATEDEKATATRRKEAAVMAYAELERLLKDNEKNASAAHLDEGFDAARDALRQFAESVVDAFAFDESAAKAKREEFPELFFKS